MNLELYRDLSRFQRQKLEKVMTDIMQICPDHETALNLTLDGWAFFISGVKIASLASAGSSMSKSTEERLAGLDKWLSQGDTMSLT